MGVKKLEVYKCNLCGNVVEATRDAGGRLVCCGQPMELQVENTVEASVEKHVPVVEVINDEVRVSVGSVAHPMEEKHYIEWIEVIAGDTVYREHLHPGLAPEARFRILAKEMTARAYCNLHGLWKSS